MCLQPRVCCMYTAHDDGSEFAKYKTHLRNTNGNDLKIE